MSRIPLITPETIDARTAKIISDGEGSDWQGVWNVTKTPTNYTNRLANTDFDDFLEGVTV